MTRHTTIPGLDTAAPIDPPTQPEVDLIRALWAARADALHSALQVCPSAEPAEVIRVARQFEAYLTEEVPPPAPADASELTIDWSQRPGNG